MLEVKGGDAISHRGDADTSSGKDGVAARTMVGRSAVRRGQSGVPSMFARLSLRRKQRCVGEQLGFLGKNNVSGRSFKHRLIERLPGVAIACLNGPKAFGDPPPVGINNGAERLNVNNNNSFVTDLCPARSDSTSMGPEWLVAALRMLFLRVPSGQRLLLQGALGGSRVQGGAGRHHCRSVQVLGVRCRRLSRHRVWAALEMSW